MKKLLIAVSIAVAVTATSLVESASASTVAQSQRSETATIGACTIFITNGPLGGGGNGGAVSANDPDCAEIGLQISYFDPYDYIRTQKWTYDKIPGLNIVKYVGSQRIHNTTYFAKDKAGVSGTTGLLPSDRLAKYRASVQRIASKELGKSGTYTEGGFWCAKFTSYVYQAAKVPNVAPSDSPKSLYFNALTQGRVTTRPSVGGHVYVDLFAGQWGPGYVNHIGIIESVSGSTFTTIERNPVAGKPDVVVRQVRHIGDPDVLFFSRLG